MGEYYQRHLQYVKRAMSFLELKKKTKRELVQLAGYFNTQTIGTKESLISTMSMKITTILLQNRPESLKYTVEEYMMIPAFRSLPENCKEFIRQVVRNYKKQARESGSFTDAPDPPVPTKPVMSFNPTFQNYNFIPLFQNNMNFNGANNYMGHMMGQQHMIAQPTHPYVGHMNTMPYQFMGGQQPVSLVDSTVTSQPNYPLLFNPSMMGKQPQLVPVMASNPLQMSTASSMSPIDQRLRMSNPMMNPLMFTSQLQSFPIQQSSSTSESQKKLQDTNVKKPPLLSLSSSSTGIPKRDLTQLKQSEQPPLPPVEPKCICNSLILNEHKLAGRLICQSCGNSFHEQCLSMTDASLTEKEMFECPSCTLRTMNPLVQVGMVLKEEVINFNNIRDKNYLTAIKLDRKHFDMNFLDIRLVKLDGVNHYDSTWPDHAIVKINDQVVQEYKPLQYLSCVKKRKDSSIAVDPAAIKKYTNTLTLRIEVKSIGKDQQKNFRTSEGSLFALGVYLASNISADTVIKQVQRRDMKSCRKLIEDNMVRGSNEQVVCHQLSISLNDPYNMQKIRMPARGKYCNHAQCFNLETFVLMMSSTQYPTWRCPICKNRCFSLYVDSYIEEILKEAKAAGDLAQEVSFDVTGYRFTKEIDFIEVDDDAPENASKPNKQ